MSDPQPVIRGSRTPPATKNMNVSFTIDWLSMSEKGTERHEFPLTPSYVGNETFEQSRGRFGYLSARTWLCGAVALYAGCTPAMGAHYQLSGSTLRNLAARGETWATILAWHTQQAHTCSRLDLACDVKGNSTLIEILQQELREGKNKGSARTITEVKSITGRGHTIYVGSRQSEMFCRVYDKAAEQGSTEPWVRIEVELKGRRANDEFLRLSRSNGLSVPEQTTAAVRHLLEIEHPDWQEIWQSRVALPELAQVRSRETRDWLIRSCVPSLVRLIKENPQDDVLGEFMNAVVERLHGSPVSPDSE